MQAYQFFFGPTFLMRMLPAIHQTTDKAALECTTQAQDTVPDPLL